MSDGESDHEETEEIEAETKSENEGEEGEEESKSEPEEAEEEAREEVPLNDEIVAQSLSLLAKTGNGLAHAYTRFEASNRNLTDVSRLESFVHLRFIDLSNNRLRSVAALNRLKFLLTLKLDSNELSTVDLQPLTYLQTLSLSNNRIRSAAGIEQPRLETLNLNHNQIDSCFGLEHNKLPNLTTLEMRENRLTTTAGIDLPNLKSFYLAMNMITKLEDLDKMERLTTLHLRDNKIETLDGFYETMKQLQYVNLRANNVSDPLELKKLAVLPMLRALVLLETPISETDSYRMEALVAIEKLERLDKDPFTEDERSDAQEEQKRRAEELRESTIDENGKAEGAPAAAEEE